MRNTNIGILMALLVALSTSLAEATVAGESLPISLSSRDTTPLDQAWSSLRPAPKTAAQADDCPSVDVTALGESSLFSLFDTFADQADQTSEGRGELNEHLNTRLDSFIVAAVEDGAINNFEDMTCYFANMAGSPPVADLYCEGPLRPTSADLAQSLTQISREEQEGSAPQLQQNAPNPFNSQTILSYFLHAPGPARLEVFALTGQRVAVLHQGPQQAGYHRLHWNGRDDAGRSVASGMYLYRLVTNESVLTRKLMLLR